MKKTFELILLALCFISVAILKTSGQNADLTASLYGELASGKCGPSASYSLNETGNMNISEGIMSDYDSQSAPWANYAHLVHDVSLHCEYVGKNSFKDMTLSTIMIYDTVKQIAAGAFDGVEKVPGKDFKITYAGTKAQWEKIIIGENNSILTETQPLFADNTVFCGPNLRWRFSSSTGQLVIEGFGPMYDYEYNNVTTFSTAPWNCYADQIVSISLPNGLTSIGTGAFYYCNYLESLQIPETVEKIGIRAFFGCMGLSGVVKIPKNVKEIGDEAFKICTSLTGFQVDIKNAYFSNDKSGMLYNKNKTELLSCPGGTAQKEISVSPSVREFRGSPFGTCKNIEKVVLPYNVNYIGGYLFYHCENLKEIYFSSNVQRIDDCAFADCDNLTDVYFSGSSSDWQRISIGSGNSGLQNATIHYGCEPAENFTQNIGTSESTLDSPNSAVYAASEKEILEQLQIDTEALLRDVSFGKDVIRGPFIKFLWKEFYLFEMDGKFEFKLGDLPVQVKVDSDKKTVQVLLGLEIIKDEAGIGADVVNKDNSLLNKSTYWSESYKQVKSLYTTVTGNKVDTTKLWNQFSSLRGQLKEFDANLLVNAKGKVAGFITFGYEDGRTYLAEGGIVLSASIGGEFVGRVPPPFSICYCTLGLNASTSDTLTFDWHNDSNRMEIKGDIEASLVANIGIGVGGKGFISTYLEGGVDGGLYLKAGFDTANIGAKLEDCLNLSMKANVYVKGSFLGMKGEKKWPIGEPLVLYPRNNATLNEASLLDEFDKQNFMHNAVPLSRDYLNVDNSISLLEIDNSDKLYSDKGVYDYNAPILAALQDGTLLLFYLDDDGSKNAINRTSLFYRTYRDGVWSEAKMIDETGTFNESARIVVNGDTICILWLKSTTKLQEDSTLEDIIPTMELYYTEYQNGIFLEPLQLTNNALAEIGYELVSENGHMAAVWLENSENDPFLEEGVNTIKAREMTEDGWSDIRTLVSVSETLTDMAAFYKGDVLQVVYGIYNTDDIKQIVFDNAVIAEGSNLQYYNGKLFFLSDDKLMQYSFEESKVKETGVQVVSNYRIENGRIYTTVMENFRTELYEADFDGEKASTFKAITNFGRYIRDYGVAYDANGKPVYVLNLVEVRDGDEVYGTSELVVCRESVIHDIALDAVYFDQGEIAPNAKLSVNLNVRNAGNERICGFHLMVADDSGIVLAEKDFEEELNIGEAKTLSMEYILPETVTYTQTKWVVYAYDDENDCNNNTQEISYGYGDLIVSDLAVSRVSEGGKLIGKVRNIGYAALDDVQISLYDPQSPKSVLLTISCGRLEAQSACSFSMNIPEKYLTVEDKLTMHGLTVTVETTGEESNYGNNDDKIVFGDLSTYTIALVDDNQLLDIISADDFEGYRYAKEGFRFEGWFTAAGEKVTEISKEVSENMVLFARFCENKQNFDIYKVFFSQEENDISATVEYGYNRDEHQLVLAVYNADTGRLLSVKQKTVSAGELKTEISDSLGKGEEKYIVKVFFMKKYNPLWTPFVYET